jgi:hypothetical protein
LEEINPLQTTLIERGIVSSRVALLLRSAEIKPIVLQICSYEQHLSLSFFFLSVGVLKGYCNAYPRAIATEGSELFIFLLDGAGTQALRHSGTQAQTKCLLAGSAAQK